MSKSSQSFLARNRAPRVQIEYDVETYGADRKVELPFVVGVLSDLSGKSNTARTSVQDRKVLDVDVDNFDDRMKSIAPTAVYTVPNTLTGEGRLPVSLSFEHLADFSPGAVSRQIEPLRKLLEARTQLAHLLTYMDGKSGAEALISELLADTSALTSLTTSLPEASDRVDDFEHAVVDLKEAAAPPKVQQPGMAEVLSELRDTVESGDEITEADLDVDGPHENIPQMDEVAPSAQQREDANVGETTASEPTGDLEVEERSTTGEDQEVSSDPVDADEQSTFPDTSGEARFGELIDTTLSEEQPIAQEPFGKLDLNRPDDIDDAPGKFRIAVLGDFSGRANRGEVEIGAGLTARRAIKLDVDTLDDVIAGFANTLLLPIGADGTEIEINLGELDDLHPDELFEKVEVFDELSALRQRIQVGNSVETIAEMQGWPKFADIMPAANRGRAPSGQVPAGCKLSEFQALISDVRTKPAGRSSIDALLKEIVAPHVQAAPDPSQEAMLTAVDQAISATMRRILHDPGFQAIEATWRSLEFLARRVETGPKVEIVLYDVSAEEWAADLAAQEDLSESGLFEMLAQAPRMDASQGSLSAVFGLYSLEETPPHAELMARMAKIAAWMKAPFMAAISPKFLETRKEDRHPLVRQSWDELRALPDSAYAGLATPRFLLRHPYGATIEPVERFDFEEFNVREGLKGMLWGNPVILSAVLMAKTAASMGKDMRLGELMTAGDMPFHYMTDQYGDQVALPCTERMLSTSKMAEVVNRGFMPMLSIKGRNEVRQGSFQSLGSAELAGVWQAGTVPDHSRTGTSADVQLRAAPRPVGTAGSNRTRRAHSEDPRAHLFADEGIDDSDTFGPPEGGTALDAPEETDTDDDLDALMSGLGDDEPGVEEDSSQGLDDDLDALLAGFGDDEGADTETDEEMDPDLAALLESL
ncbi:MAG: type VI secretion system contractile sheath small subunit [Pseudomonadota bacterium]